MNWLGAIGQLATALGLKSMSSQAANAVAITGGTIDGTNLGATTPGEGTFSYLYGGGNELFNNGLVRSNGSVNTNGNAFRTQDRTTANNADYVQLYRISAVVHLNDSANGDILLFDTTGNLTVKGLSVGGSLTVTGNLTVGGTTTLVTPNFGDNSTKGATTAFVQSAVSTLPITTASAGRTLVAADLGTVIECTSASAATFTIPAAANVNWPVGGCAWLFVGGAGAVTVAAASGVTLTATTTTSTKTYQMFMLRKRATNTWHVGLEVN